MVARQQDVLYNLYRGGYLDKSQYESYKLLWHKRFQGWWEVWCRKCRDYLYYSVMSEAQDVMYDYLVTKWQGIVKIWKW